MTRTALEDHVDRLKVFALPLRLIFENWIELHFPLERV